MSDQEYNGWSNRETWATALHIDNDSGLYDNVLEQTKNYTDTEHPIAGLAGEIESFIDEVLDYENIKHNRNAFLMLTDIGSLYRVNWREIAEYYLTQVKEEEVA
jgi:hypothetical protein